MLKIKIQFPQFEIKKKRNETPKNKSKINKSYKILKFYE